MRSAAQAAAGVAAVLALVVADDLVGAPLVTAPVPALQQLDLLYLDEPAPLLDRLGVEAGWPAAVVVCEACAPPDVEGAGQVVVTDDEAVARAYALARPSPGGVQVGPGYAVVDSGGRVRYRTFDPALSDHGEEVRRLLEGVP